MKATEIQANCAPESDPEREGWRIYLCMARQIRPSAGVDELVDMAISFAPRIGIVFDRAVVEQVALGMMFTVKDVA